MLKNVDRESMEIADKVFELREERGWSQIKTAEKAGISNTTMNTLEMGRRKPTLVTLRKLAKAFGVPVTELLGDEKT